MMPACLGSPRLERILLTGMLLVFVYVLLFFVIARLGLVHGRHLLAFAGAGAIAWGFVHWVLPQVSPTKPDGQASLAPLLIIGVAGAVLFVVTQPGYVLVGHDPIIVPTLAEALLSHATTMDVYQPGDPGFAYPPGYPILFSNISWLLPTPLQALFAFKAWTIILLLLLPLGWAWMAHRIFLVPMPFWLILLLSYVAVFGTVQLYKPLEYAEILTGCRILNGSFVRRGVPHGRAMDGLPAAAVLASLPASATIFTCTSSLFCRRAGR
jgi:hypothetical protein